MTDRHAAALRAALAERDRLPCVWGRFGPGFPAATSENVARIVEAALAAADMSDRYPKVGRSPRFDLGKVSTDEVMAERTHRGPRQPGSAGAHYDLCGADGCPCYREGMRRSAQSIPVARLRAVIALIGNDEMTPTARRMLESVCGEADQW